MTVFLTSYVSAVYPIIDIKIQNNSIQVTGLLFYDLGLLNGKAPGNFLATFNETIPYTIVTQQINVTVGNETNLTTQTVCNLNYAKEIPLRFNNSDSIVVSNTDLQTKYEMCLEDRLSYSKGLDSCNQNYKEQLDYKSNYTESQSKLQVCNVEKSTLQTEKNTLQQQFDATKNSKWWWGIVGVVIGIGIQMYRKGELGGPKKKDSEDEYNTNQST